MTVSRSLVLDPPSPASTAATSTTSPAAPAAAPRQTGLVQSAQAALGTSISGTSYAVQELMHELFGAVDGTSGASPASAQAYKPIELGAGLQNLVDALSSSSGADAPGLARLQQEYSTMQESAQASGRTPTLVEFLQTLKQALPATVVADAAVGGTVNADA